MDYKVESAMKSERDRRNFKMNEQKRTNITWILNRSDEFTEEELNEKSLNEIMVIVWDIESKLEKGEE